MYQLKYSLITLLFFVSIQTALACSMCKITLDGKTIVGNNEDMWSHEAKIWFENGDQNSYGSVYLGHVNNSPQGGMNEAGLVFDALTLLPNPRPYNKTNKKPVKYTNDILVKVMQKCATINEVELYLQDYNLSCISSGMIWFIDKAGDYLIVESDTMIWGNDPSYVLTNYRVSENKSVADIKIPRHHKGLDRIKNVKDNSFEFCASVMDTMKACRGELGDGTLYSNIFDTQTGDIYLYFYHDFSTFVKYNLKEELKKGNQVIKIPELFPENEEYEKYLSYKTPFNSHFVYWILSVSGILLLLISIYFCFSLIWNLIKTKKYFFKFSNNYFFLFILIVNFLALILIPILLIRQPIFYFGFEGSLANFPFTQQIIYFPILIALLTVVLLFIRFKFLKTDNWNLFLRMILSLNFIILVVNLIFYNYWNILI